MLYNEQQENYRLRVTHRHKKLLPEGHSGLDFGGVYVESSMNSLDR